MELDIYWIGLVTLLPTVAVVSGWSAAMRLFQKIRTRSHTAPVAYSEPSADAKRFRRIFLQVYLLVMGSEWLQGPHTYTLFRTEKAFQEPVVASLYATVYISAAASALVTGFLADRFGRRAAGLAFCVVHSAACLTVLSDALPVLYFGRVLAGVSITLLWTTFESWMVTEFNARGFDRGEDGISLSSMFGTMTTTNCIGAIIGGVLGHCIVVIMGSRVCPFLVGIIFEVAAVFLMMKDWNENYGSISVNALAATKVTSTGSPDGRLGDVRVWSLSFVTCFFEGTGFLILYFFPGMLKEAHNRTALDSASEIPYGVAFACFMASMILGAFLFKRLSEDSACTAPFTPGWYSKMSSATLLAVVMLVACSSLFALTFFKSETAFFLAFLVFETCNGVYVPSIAHLRGTVVNADTRTWVYGLMKIPLFIYVVGSLDMMGLEGHYRRLILLCAAVSLFLATLCACVLRSRSDIHLSKLIDGECGYECSGAGFIAEPAHKDATAGT